MGLRANPRVGGSRGGKGGKATRAVAAGRMLSTWRGLTFLEGGSRGDAPSFIAGCGGETLISGFGSPCSQIS
jgi:hypothetical protein